MKRLTVGIVAHVDAGKTTLTEGLLYASGTIDKLGRVDKRSSFLDTEMLERERGITIFSKQAVLSFSDTELTIVDTPGHVDFSEEAERALAVEDYAILVISAPNGVESHTKTLWNLLSARKIPTFIFVNKTDITEKTKKELISELRAAFSPFCVDFSSSDTKIEDAAGCDSALIEEFFDTGTLSDDSVSDAILERKLFPCFFGSALKMTGVREFLSDFDRYTREKSYNKRLFGARVYKINRDASGKRLTYMKITGGKISAKDIITVKSRDGEVYSEKIDEIRLYSGSKFKPLKEATAGMLVAVLGPQKTEAGLGLGFERNDEITLTPVLDYKMILPKDINVYDFYTKLSALREQSPSLAISYDERTKEIRVRLMGEIQIEVLKRIIRDRFSLEVDFGEGGILYKETIESPVVGRGHFEPLRHYAEVHLLLEPLPRGSGIITESDVSLDLLSLNWQRLVITHLEERAHRGVLTGSPITDIKITLKAGRAHLKHTEGGDFRQATYRAVRQGLMKAKSILLEPTFNFRIELPEAALGRCMNDLTSMRGKTDAPIFENGTAILTGYCPVSTIRSYATELRAYTAGNGKIQLTNGDYIPVEHPEEIIEKIGYTPELDERNTPNSVFCKGGSGYVVPWDEADALMHIATEDGSEDKILTERAVRQEKVTYESSAEEEKELMRIFESTYGKIKERRVNEKTENSADATKTDKKPKKQKKKGEDVLIIDGYNFIFANDEWRRLAETDISLARDALTRIMCDYSAFRRVRVYIVFDAYKRGGGEGSVERCGDVSVIYTKENQTADSYIEKTAHDLADGHSVRVVTSDFNEQLIILGVGALRVSAREFYAELKLTDKEIKEAISSL
jgi:small GTP-binding protein